MSTVVLEGLSLTLLAGLFSGNCMLPMKFARRWQWENVWLVFSIVSLLILPWALALTLAGDSEKFTAASALGNWHCPFCSGPDGASRKYYSGSL